MNIPKRDAIIKAMKPARLLEIPHCSFCEKPAVVDGPTLSGQWAYMCADCLIDKADILYVADMGTRLVKKEPATPTTDEKIYDVIELTTAVTLIIDGYRIIKCPVCSYEHTMEPDASGVIKCGGCSRKLRLALRL